MDYKRILERLQHYACVLEYDGDTPPDSLGKNGDYCLTTALKVFYKKDGAWCTGIGTFFLENINASSAYRDWLDAGYKGTLADFLAWLQQESTNNAKFLDSIIADIFKAEPGSVLYIQLIENIKTITAVKFDIEKFLTKDDLGPVIVESDEGIGFYRKEITYKKFARCIGSDGIRYKSKGANNIGHDPALDNLHQYWEVDEAKGISLSDEPELNKSDTGASTVATKILADRIKSITALKTGDIIHNGVSATLALNEIPLWLGAIEIDKNQEPELYAMYGDTVPDYSGKFLSITGGNRAAVGVKQDDALKATNINVMSASAHGGGAEYLESCQVFCGAKDQVKPYKYIINNTEGNPFAKIDGAAETYPVNIAAYARIVGTWMPAPEILAKWKDSPKTKECYMFNKDGELIHTLPSPIDWHKTTIGNLVYYETDIITFVKP